MCVNFFFYQNIEGKKCRERKIMMLEINWYKLHRLILIRLNKLWFSFNVIIAFHFSSWLDIKNIFMWLRAHSVHSQKSIPLSMISHWVVHLFLIYFSDFNELKKRKQPIKITLQIVKLHKILCPSYFVAHCAPNVTATPFSKWKGKKVATIHIHTYLHKWEKNGVKNQ